MDNLDLFEEQIKLAKISRETLAEFKGARYGLWFHLRPIAKKITIVTTHPDLPMRGIAVAKTKIRDALTFLAGCIASDGKTIDWEKIKSAGYNIGKGF